MQDLSAAQRGTVYRVLGREVRVPVQVQRARSLSATFLVDRRAAQAMVDHTGLHTYEVWPGRTLVSLAVLTYEEGDWGSYHEVAVAFPIASPDASGSVSRRFPFSLRHFGGIYLHYLPVTAEFTCEAGRAVYGFPKWMAEIEVHKDRKRQRGVFRSDGELVFELEVNAQGARAFPRATVAAYAYREGVLRRCDFSIQGKALGVRPGGASLTMGSHRIADELRRLGLPKHALMSATIGHISSTFGAPEVVNLPSRQ